MSSTFSFTNVSVIINVYYPSYADYYPNETRRYGLNNILGTNKQKSALLPKIGIEVSDFRYSLIKPISNAKLKISKKAIGCSYFFECRCIDEEKVQKIIKHFKKLKEKRKWLDYFSIFVISQTSLDNIKNEILIIEGERKKIEQILNIHNDCIVEMHETRSILYTGNRTIVRTILGYIIIAFRDKFNSLIQNFRNNDFTLKCFQVIYSYNYKYEVGD